MFSYVHYRITHLLALNHMHFRDPDAVLKLNGHFSAAFIKAVGGIVGPWEAAFRQCTLAGVVERNARDACRIVLPSSLPGTSSGILPGCAVAAQENAIKACTVAMGNVHIHTDLANALREVGCGNARDFGNVLVFVEQSSRDALEIIDGSLLGALYANLKELLLPLDKEWRNEIFKAQCRVGVPEPEWWFRRYVVIDAPEPPPLIAMH